MKANVYASELLASIKLASTKKEQRVISGVYIENNGIEYAIASTDSYRLVEFTNKNWDGFKNESDKGHVIIDAKDIKTNVKAADYRVIIEANDDENTVTMIIHSKKGDVRTVIINRIDGNYPNYKRLFEFNFNDPVNKIIVNPTFMMDVCDAVKKAYGKEAHVAIELQSANKPVVLTAKGNEEGEMRSIIMPIREL